MISVADLASVWCTVCVLVYGLFQDFQWLEKNLEKVWGFCQNIPQKRMPIVLHLADFVGKLRLRERDF